MKVRSRSAPDTLGRGRRPDSPLGDAGGRAGSWEHEGHPRLPLTRRGHVIRIAHRVRGIKGSNRHRTCREPSRCDLAVGRTAPKLPGRSEPPELCERNRPPPRRPERPFHLFPEANPILSFLRLKAFGGPHCTVARGPPLVTAHEAPPDGPWHLCTLACRCLPLRRHDPFRWGRGRAKPPRTSGPWRVPPTLPGRSRPALRAHGGVDLMLRVSAPRACVGPHPTRP